MAGDGARGNHQERRRVERVEPGRGFRKEQPRGQQRAAGIEPQVEILELLDLDRAT